jgi:hypothetical protein
MTDFDDRLQTALSAEDEKFVADHLDEKGYYAEVLSSLRGPGGAMNILAWVGIFIFSAILIGCLIGAFQAETSRAQILFVAFAVMANSGQIAIKLWANMRLNRRAVMVELAKLRLELARA